MDAVNLRFPPITVEEVAQTAVDSILRNEVVASVPRANWWFCAVMNMMAPSAQAVLRDHILKERETTMVRYDEKLSRDVVSRG